MCRALAGKGSSVMECPSTLPEEQCAPLHTAACGAVVAFLLSTLLCVLWFKASSKWSITMQQQTNAEPVVAPAVPVANACRAVQQPIPLLQHDERLSVEVSSLLGRGRRSFIFRGGLSAHLQMIDSHLDCLKCPCHGRQATQQHPNLPVLHGPICIGCCHYRW